MKNYKSLIALAVVGTLLSACAVVSDRETTGEYMDDSVLTTRVKSALFKEPNLKASQIHVESFQGAVQLSGFVDSIAEKLKAEQVAATAKGTKSVKNSLVVRTQKK